MTFAFVCIGLVLVPFIALGVLGIIGLIRPDIRKKGMRQLRQPFAQRQWPTQRSQMRDLEDEAIRRFGPKQKPQ